MTKNHLSKIFIGCQQQCFFIIGSVNDDIVRSANVRFRYVKHFVTIPAKTIYYLPFNILVSQQIHAGNYFTGYTTSACNASAANANAS